MKIGILWTRKELNEFSCAFNAGGGGGNSSSSTEPRNVAPAYSLGGGTLDSGGGTPGVFITGANNAGDVSGGAPIGGNGMARLSSPGGGVGGIGGSVVSAAAQPATGNSSVSAGGALSTAVQINSTEKTNAPVVNISSGYGSSISAPTASTEPTTAAISSLTWLNWLEIGAFALFGVWLMRKN